MANKKVAEVESTVEVAEPVSAESLAKMKADAKAAADAYRAAKAAMPKLSAMEIVLDKQSNGISDKRAREYFSGLVRSRVKAGQNLDEARDAVVEMFTESLTAESANIANE